MSAGGLLRVFASRESQAAAAANWLARQICAAIAGAGAGAPARVALAGGKTPAPAYALLAKKRLNWSRAEFTPTDERLVPPNHPRSNITMLRQTLGANKRLVALAEGAPAPPPHVVLLGAGADGHIASLFASKDANMRRRRVFCVCPAAQPEARLTLPLRALALAPRLLLLICGGDKLQTLLRAPRAAPTTAARLQRARSLAGLRGAGGAAFFWRRGRDAIIRPVGGAGAGGGRVLRLLRGIRAR